MKLIKRSYVDYLAMFLLLAVSGIPILQTQTYQVLFAIILAVLFLVRKGQKMDEEILYMIGIILFLVLCQAVTFSFFKTITIVGMVLRMLSAYFVVKLAGKYFLDYYIRIMVFFAITSLIFFIPIFVIPGFMDKLLAAAPSFFSYQYELWGFEVDRKTLLIYNLLQETPPLLRNPGPFWEPGAFGGFLAVALIFNSIKQGELFTRINCLFIFTIITTQSTTTYIALFIYIFLYILVQNYSSGAKLAVILFGVAGFVAFQTIPFLGDKIKTENEGVKDAIEENGGDTRLASAVLDWDDISRYPFAGRGLWDETRVDKKFQFVIRNNGFTNFFAQWGIPFVLFFFYWYYRSFYQYCRIYGSGRLMPIVMILIICILSFGENYFNIPFFWAFALLFIPFRDINPEDDTNDVALQ